MFRFDINEKYLITVSGTTNSGKSTVLSSVIDKFVDNGATIVNDLKSGLRDRVVIIEYKNEKIGICTEGDVKSILEHWLPRLLDNDCKFIITPTKAHGDTCAYVNDFAKNNKFILIPLHKFKWDKENDFSILKNFIFDLF